MLRLADLPRVPDYGLSGSFGATAADRIALQRAISRVDGHLARGRVLHFSVLFAALPEAAHEVLVTRAKSFEKAPGFRLLLHTLAGQGLFTSEGSLWKRQRKLMAPLFQPAPIHQYAEIMQQVSMRAADSIGVGQRVDLAHETTRIAMSIVGKALFDIDTFDEADALGGALTTCLRWVDRNLASPAVAVQVLLIDLCDALAKRSSGGGAKWVARLQERAATPFLLPGVRDPELVAAARLLDRRMQEMIDERRASGLVRDDLMTRLLTAVDPETGEHMSDRQVRDEAITLFVAGHETTATALAWSFYLLSRDPEALQRAEQEADAFGDAPITEWQPHRLAYLTRVFREAMRLYPPLVMFARRSREALDLFGTQIPDRTITIVSAYAQHHRARSYPDPERFDPDRWLPEREAERHKSAYLPFGAGPRVCIGVHFAMLEGPIVLATLLRRWRFEIDPRRCIEPDDFATLRPRGGVSAIAHPRHRTRGKV